MTKEKLQPIDDSLLELAETMQQHYGYFVETGTKSALGWHQVSLFRSDKAQADSREN